MSSGALNAIRSIRRRFALNFINNPNNRSYQPRAYANDYTLPEKVYEYTASVQQELPGNMAATAAYVGSQGRNLFLRSIANRTIGVQSNGANAATQIREFDIVTRNADGTIATIQRPFAEIDYKTSGGHDSYNAMQLSLTRRSARGHAERPVHARLQQGQHRRVERSDDGGQQRPGARGLRLRQRLQQLRHPPHVQPERAVYDSRQRAADGRMVDRRHRQRAQRPAGSRADRAQRHRLRRRGGDVWNNAAAGRTAVINVPGGGFSRNTRRPDLIPGVDPFIQQGGRIFLNPAAFATPAPGTFGNLERNSIHGPGFQARSIWSSRSG